MKKLVLILCLFSAVAKAQSPKLRVMAVDSAGNNTIAAWYLPQVAISGYFANLVNLPTTIAGYGITDAIGSSSAINTLSKTANYTIVSGDISASKQPIIYLAMDCTSGNLTATLPSASTYSGYLIRVIKTDASANTITVSGVSTDNIIGVKNSVKEFVSLSGNWVNN